MFPGDVIDIINIDTLNGQSQTRVCEGEEFLLRRRLVHEAALLSEFDRRTGFCLINAVGEDSIRAVK